jgi:two-component system sensor histidine kinase and response regulator WspE
VPNINAAAILDDGSPVLIVDLDDLRRSIDKVLRTGRLRRADEGDLRTEQKRVKRILVVDDSITVREVQRQLLANQGYEVEVAVDGMEGWNAARQGAFDLVITDVDMPRLNGIDLVRMIRQDPRLQSVPVVIVSYKDREEDRLRGLEVGANYYLTKSSFHDETLLGAVEELIGEPGG